MDMQTLRDLPSVEQVLQSPALVALAESYGRPLVLEAVRRTLETARREYPESGNLPDSPEIYRRVQVRIEELVAPTLQPVINATGVILQTNLGRAPLSPAAVQAAAQAGLGYSTLEYDLAKGKRGSRLIHAEKLLRQLTGAEAAMVVNNNAAAVLLALTALARRRGAVIARSQLVEIGGGFRIPDVMKQSGARLVEIGTTNRVHLRDYEEALQQNPALFLRAHRSNFRILGFTSEPELSEISALAHREGIEVVDDLGSGSLLDTARFGLGHEPMVQESLQAGADLVCFSGDKLLGGPQAGIIIGKSALIEKLSRHPLARAIRADKLCLAALSATLLHYLKDEAEKEIPIWRMISTGITDIQSRASVWVEALGAGEVIPSESTVGGGSLPGETMPTFVLSLQFRSPDRALERLRRQHPPVIARTQASQVLFDPRTVLPEQETALLSAVRNVLNN
jgi:L-seryl-tRNA(Ser) seleniumtransferase